MWGLCQPQVLVGMWPEGQVGGAWKALYRGDRWPWMPVDPTSHCHRGDQSGDRRLGLGMSLKPLVAEEGEEQMLPG